MVVVSGAVELVAAGLGDDVDDAAAGAAELGGEGVGFDAKFLDGIGGRREGDAVKIADGIDGSIEEDFVGGSSAAADGEVGIEDAAAAAGIADLALGDDAGGKADDGHDVSLDEGQFVDRLGVDGGADAAGFGLEDGAFLGDLDFGGDAGKGHFEVEGGGLVDSEDEVFLELLLEALGANGDFIETGLERREDVGAGGVSGSGLGGTGIGFGDGDGGVGDGAIGGIGHGSREAGGEGLGAYGDG